MAARQTIKKITVKTRRRKTGGNTGYKKCPTCKGSGRVKAKK